VRILIVNSYHADWRPKIEAFKAMVAQCTEDCEVRDDIDLHPDFDLTGFDALVLSGSPNLLSRNEYVPRYLKFLSKLTQPTLGICYGHQMLARAFGARVLGGEKLIEGDEIVRIIEAQPLFHGLPPEISVRESHREHVVLEDLDKAGFDLLANSSSCAVEAIHHVERPLFGTQFHIERSGIIGQEIMANFCRFVREHRSN
jgi:GMP synthase (glutamine-hydrolysing)